MKNQIQTFEDACKALNLNPDSLPEVTMIPERDQKAIVSFFKLSVIARALNEGWEPNWEDFNQYKYYPWFEMEKSGVGLSSDVYAYADSASSVGSRLVFKSAELAKYAGPQFIDLYRDLMTI